MNHTSCQFRDKHTVGGIVFYKHAFLVYTTDRSKAILLFYVLCFGDEFLCGLRLMYLFIYLVEFG